MTSRGVRYPGRARLIQVGWPADLVEFIDDLWSRTGGPTDRLAANEDDIESSETAITTLQGTQASISARVGDLENTPPPTEIIHDIDNPLPQFQPLPEPDYLQVVPVPVEQDDPLPAIFMPYTPPDVEAESLTVEEGTNAAMGVAALALGTVTVSNTRVTASTRIFLTPQESGVNIGHVYVSARTAGTDFTISSTDANDDRDVAWLLVEPAP